MAGNDKMHPIADRWGRIKNFDFCAEEEPTTTWPYMVWIQPSSGSLKVRNWLDTEWVSLATADHGELVGLGDDDHPQYSLADGSRAFTGVVGGVTPTLPAHLATKGYVDGAVITDHGALGGLGDDDHTQYLLTSGARVCTGNLTANGPFVSRSFTFPAVGLDWFLMGYDDDSGGVLWSYSEIEGVAKNILMRGMLTRIRMEDDAVDDIQDVLRLDRVGGSPVQDGYGIGLGFHCQNDAGAGSDLTYAAVRMMCTDVSDGAEKGAVIFYTVDGADDGLAERARLDHDFRFGLGTPSPLENLAGGSTGLAGVGFHAYSASVEARLIAEGSSGASLALIDLGGAADDKVFLATCDAGVVQFSSLKDDLTTRVDHIFGMDLGSGWCAFGTDTPDGHIHVLTSSAGSVKANALNDLVLERTTAAGMTILFDSESLGGIAWGTGGTTEDTVYHAIVGYGADHATYPDSMRIQVSNTNRVWISPTALYPNTAKAMDFGLATNEWDDLYYVTEHVGTSRLVRSTRTCPVCGSEMSRGTGTTIYRGEVADYAMCFCLSCGNAAVEILNHLPPEKEAKKRPPPKVVLESAGVKAGGRNRSVAVDFRYGDDKLDEYGDVVEPAIRNSTRLGEHEFDEFFAMDDPSRLEFLRMLGEREWYSREEERLMREEAESLRVEVQSKVGSWIGHDLLIARSN